MMTSGAGRPPPPSPLAMPLAQWLANYIPMTGVNLGQLFRKRLVLKLKLCKVQSEYRLLRYNQPVNSIKRMFKKILLEIGFIEEMRTT